MQICIYLWDENVFQTPELISSKADPNELIVFIIALAKYFWENNCLEQIGKKGN